MFAASHPTPTASRPPPPLQSVVDGDLCEMFASLPADKQAAIAKDLDRSVQDVLRKLEDVRNKII